MLSDPAYEPVVTGNTTLVRNVLWEKVGDVLRGKHDPWAVSNVERALWDEMLFMRGKDAKETMKSALQSYLDKEVFGELLRTRTVYVTPAAENAVNILKSSAARGVTGNPKGLVISENILELLEGFEERSRRYNFWAIFHSEEEAKAWKEYGTESLTDEARQVILDRAIDYRRYEVLAYRRLSEIVEPKLSAIQQELIETERASRRIANLYPYSFPAEEEEPVIVREVPYKSKKLIGPERYRFEEERPTTRTPSLSRSGSSQRYEELARSGGLTRSVSIYRSGSQPRLLSSSESGSLNLPSDLDLSQSIELEGERAQREEKDPEPELGPETKDYGDDDPWYHPYPDLTVPDAEEFVQQLRASNRGPRRSFQATIGPGGRTQRSAPLPKTLQERLKERQEAKYRAGTVMVYPEKTVLMKPYEYKRFQKEEIEKAKLRALEIKRRRQEASAAELERLSDPREAERFLNQRARIMGTRREPWKPNPYPGWR